MAKTALITGASRGIGRAAAVLFGAKGYNVIVNYASSAKKAEEVCEIINSAGGSALPFCADVSDRGAVNAMTAFAEEKFGGVDVLVNNAGIAEQIMFCDITEEKWDRMFDVDVKGVYNCTQSVLPHMVHNKFGRIINVSSMWGITGASCEVHYSAAKAAVIGFTKALAKELGPSGITVNAVAPGVIATEMNGMLDEETMAVLKEETPLERIGTPEDVAEAVFFLASDKASFITGETVSVNGGFVI
ncbi:MAG: 3-oxoacyl-ACP reductase FabG [Oscillospiraceae bacterium]|nr:3-oxoacyl-ACP reductase FabG [Oscillospiraceae bacterium]